MTGARLRSGLMAVLRASALAAGLLPVLGWAAPAPTTRGGVIRIGLAAPLTGPDAGFGQGARLGAEQAVADINWAGGVGGQRLQLVVLDDAGDPRQGADVARRFAADGVRLVVGHLDSGATALALPIYEEAGIVAITPAATLPALTARGAGLFFRLCGSDAQQGAVAGAWLAAHARDKPVAIVNDRTAFGRGLADEVARALKARGGREALFEGITRGERDLSGLVARMRAERVEAVYFGGLSADAGLLLKALREAGFVGTFVGSDGLLDKDFPVLAGGTNADGVHMTLAAEPRRLPDPREVRPGERRTPRPPEAEAFAGRTYAAVEVLKGAIEASGASEGRALADVLRGGRPVRTLLGEVAFDGRGDPLVPPFGLVVWRRTGDGRIDYAGNPAPP